MSSLECQEALGMETGVIAEEQITSSSYYNYLMSRASQARLYRERIDGYQGGGWVTVVTVSQWLQIDFISRHSLTRVATQGQNYNHNLHLNWVTKYKLQYRDYGESFKYYKEQGQSTEKVNTFNAIL